MKYEQRGAQIGALVDRKQIEYGDSYHKSGEVVAGRDRLRGRGRGWVCSRINALIVSIVLIMQVEFCECPECKGEGIIREPYVGTMYWQVTCERCGGCGEVPLEEVEG